MFQPRLPGLLHHHAGVQHSVEVAAISLYEAVIELADVRRDPLVEVESSVKNPSEQVLKRQLRELLAKKSENAR